jgi:hypothetical protein
MYVREKRREEAYHRRHHNPHTLAFSLESCSQKEFKEEISKRE